MARLESLKLPGDVRGLVATDPAGPIFVACSSGSRKTVMLAVDRSGTVRWRREFDGRPGLPRAGADGTVWIATGSTLHQIGTNGAVLRSDTPDHEDGEHLGAFVLSPDGFYAAWVPTVPGVARLARYGTVTWSAPLPLGALSYRGVVEMRADNGWRARPMKSWTPRRIKVDFRQPLLVAGDRALVDVLDADGGIGVCTILDTATGEVVAATEPAPTASRLSPGRAGSWSAVRATARSPPPSTTATAGPCSSGRATPCRWSTGTGRSAARSRRTCCRPGRCSASFTRTGRCGTGRR